MNFPVLCLAARDTSHDVFTLSGGTVFPSRGLTYLPKAQCAASAKNTVQTVTLHSKGKLGALLPFSAFFDPLMFSRVCLCMYQSI